MMCACIDWVLLWYFMVFAGDYIMYRYISSTADHTLVYDNLKQLTEWCEK